MIAARVADRLIGLASTVILVRLLVPSDFGLLVMATSIIAMLALLGDFSLDLALIQNSKVERRHYDTVWTINLLFCAAYALVLLLLARPASLFYAEPRLVAVMEWLALGTLIGGFANVGVVSFRKEMHFHKEFLYLLAKRVASFTITVGLALLWGDYWALVGGTLSGIVTGLLLSYFLSSYRPTFSLSARGELLRFSKWLYLNNLIFFLNSRLADFIVGRIGGPHSLGLYSVSFEISNLPTSELAAPVNRAVFPGYSKIADDPAHLRKGFLNVISMIALFALPAGAGIVATAHLVVPTILGPQWAPAIPLIQILAVYGICIALQTNTGALFVAKGRPDLLTRLAGGHLVVMAPVLALLTVGYGVNGAATAVATCALIFLPINYYVLLRVLNLHFRALLTAVWRPAMASVAMVSVVKLFESHFGDAAQAMNQLFWLLILIGVGIAAYFVGLLVLWRLMNYPAGAEKLVWEHVARRFRFQT